MDQPKFVIEATEAETMAQSLGLPSVLHLLPTLVQAAQSLARPPISNYHVGAVGLGSDGRVFLGVNLEFPGLPLHHSVHAEQFLVTNLAVHRCPRLLAFAVSAAPCAHCRQFLQELRHSSTLKIFVTTQQKTHFDETKPKFDFTFKPLIELLPNPFGPYDLLDEDRPLLLEEQKNGLFLSTHLTKSTLLSNGFCELSVEIDSKRSDLYVNCEKLSNGFCEKFDKNETLLRKEALVEAANNSHAPCSGLSVEKESKRSDLYINNENLSNGFHEKVEKNETFLRMEALEAANNSHAPYSGCPSGVALMDCDGKVYRGLYAESAAYNPSLGPVQAALVAYIAGGGGGYERIVTAVLVEKEGAQVVQEDTARLILKKKGHITEDFLTKESTDGVRSTSSYEVKFKS